MIKVKRWFTYDSLNARLKSFKFKAMDAQDKPPEMKFNADRLSGHAVQNWVLVRLLSFIIGSDVDLDDELWKMYLTLKELIEIVCSPSQSLASLAFLKDLIIEYIEFSSHYFQNRISAQSIISFYTILN